jgi:hypothetical protein
MRQQRVWMPLPQVADADRREAAHEHLGLSANVCVRSLLFVETAHEVDQLLVPIGESANATRSVKQGAVYAVKSMASRRARRV